LEKEKNYFREIRAKKARFKIDQQQNGQRKNRSTTKRVAPKWSRNNVVCPAEHAICSSAGLTKKSSTEVRAGCKCHIQTLQIRSPVVLVCVKTNAG